MESPLETGSQTPQGPHVVILGGGIIGLSTAAALLCSRASIVANLNITVVAAAFSPDTTSGTCRKSH